MNRKKKVKIAFVYDAIYPYIKGGAERRYYEIGKRLTRQGYDVHLYGMKLWQGPSIIEREGMTLHGICPSLKLYSSSGKRSIIQAVFFGICCLSLFREDFDIIDCCGFPYFSLFSCKFVCVLKNKKLFSTWHEVWGKDYWKEYLQSLWYFGFLIEKLAVFMPDTILSVSNVTGQKIRADFSFKKEILNAPNGIDFLHIQSIKKASTKSDIIYVGRLMDFKNVDVLIKAINIVKKQIPEVSCIIIGDGPEKEKLINLVLMLKLQKNVKFLGFIENPDEIYALIKSSKLFVLPSMREGFSIVALEANACAIPVITTNALYNRTKDFVENEANGIIFDFDFKSLANIFLTSFKNNWYISTKEYCLSFARRYDWNNLNIEKIYK